MIELQPMGWAQKSLCALSGVANAAKHNLLYYFGFNSSSLNLLIGLRGFHGHLLDLGRQQTSYIKKFQPLTDKRRFLHSSNPLLYCQIISLWPSLCEAMELWAGHLSLARHSPNASHQWYYFVMTLGKVFMQKIHSL